MIRTKVNNNAIDSTKVADRSLTGSDIADGAVDSAKVRDFTLTNQDVGVLSAEISAAGVLDNQHPGGGVSVVKLGLGTYEVDFARDVTQCTSVATVGPSGAGSALGEVNVADRSGNPEAVFVDTNNSDGTGADKPFRLVIVC